MEYAETLAAAGFASGWMLVWMAAGIIPVAIHLLTRRRQVTVHWAAMELLREVIEREAKRVRIEQLVLLLIRVAILVTLALALARPFLFSDDQGTAVDEEIIPRFWIIALDTSYSMGYLEAGRTRFEIAREKALEIVENAGEGDAFALFEVAEPCRAIIARPTFDKQNVTARIRRMKALDTGGGFLDCLEQILELVNRADQVTEIPRDIEVVLLSDLGRDAWQPCLVEPGTGLLKKLSRAATLNIIPVSTNRIENVAVRELRPSQNRPTLGQPIEVSVEIENFGSSSIVDLPVQLEVNGQTVESSYVTVASRATASVVFPFVPHSMGFVVVTAQVPDDALPVDDHRTHVIEVRNKTRILFLEDRPGDARLLQTSLDPKLTGDLARSLACMSPIDSLGEDLTRWDIVVLSDIAIVNSDLLSRLERFASGGGAVIGMFGPNTPAEAWNAGLASHDLLGFRFRTPTEESSWDLDPLDYQSPIVRPFSGYPDAGLLTTPIFRYWQVEPTAAPYTLVDLALTSGDPLIVRKPVGRGTVVSMLSAPQSGLPGDARGESWNAIATWPSFVPIMQQLVKVVLDTDGTSYNVLAAQSIQGSIPVTKSGATSIKLLQPDGTESVIYGEDTSGQTGQSEYLRSWQFAGTQISGVYSARADDGAVTPFAVNVDTIQSSLESINVGQLSFSKAIVDKPSERDESPSRPDGPRKSDSGNQTRYLPQALLWVLFLLLITESTLAWLIGRRVG